MKISNVAPPYRAMDTLPKYQADTDTEYHDPPAYTSRFSESSEPEPEPDHQPPTQASPGSLWSKYHVSEAQRRRRQLLLGSLAMVLFAVAAFAFSVVSVIPRDDWYILQVNNTNVQPGVLFRNVILNQNLSATIPSNLTIADTDLSPYFRVGIMNWCEGDIVNDKWVKGKCRKWTSINMGKFYAQTAGHVGDYTVRSGDASSVYLPSGYPTTKTVNRRSKGATGAAIAGAVFSGLTLVSVLVGVPIMFGKSREQLSFYSVGITIILVIIVLNILAVVASGPNNLAGKIMEAFKDQYYLFGIEVTRKSHFMTFAGAAAGMTAGILIFALVIFYTP